MAPCCWIARPCWDRAARQGTPRNSRPFELTPQQTRLAAAEEGHSGAGVGAHALDSETHHGGCAEQRREQDHLTGLDSNSKWREQPLLITYILQYSTCTSKAL